MPRLICEFGVCKFLLLSLLTTIVCFFYCCYFCLFVVVVVVVFLYVLFCFALLSFYTPSVCPSVFSFPDDYLNKY